LKQIFSILLSLQLLLPSVAGLWTLADFTANRERIAQELCIQKEIKKNKCQGQCQLKKRINALEHAPVEKSSPIFKFKLEILYLASVPVYAISSFFLYSNNTLKSAYTGILAQYQPMPFFHPPLYSASL
jgi:hypothetical protein